jgi:hypothetical protein
LENYTRDPESFIVQPSEPGRDPADIDLLVVGNPDRGDLYHATQEAARRLNRPVNPVVDGPADTETVTTDLPKAHAIIDACDNAVSHLTVFVP